MKKYLLYFILILFISCEMNQEQNLTITDGVSEELAIYRKQQISDVTYNLSFSIPLKIEDSINSKLRLQLSIHDLSQPLFLDFKSNKRLPDLAVVNGNEILLEYKKEHLIIPSENLIIGINTIDIEFLAGEMSLNRNASYLFTLLVPDRARTLFPCFDQPNIKATYVLNITAPKKWEVLCGSPLESKNDKGDRVELQFKESDKMSTYLFSFVAGEFDVINSVDTQFKMKMLHQEKDEDKITMSTSEIFNLHSKSIDYLENYTGYKFPFQKLDFATIFSHPYGGMEHTGAIQYRQTSLFLDKNATQSQELRRAKLIAHETSHMWFGNLVTMKWFDDVWLKEVFANFIADKIINPNFKNINHDLYFLTSHYPAAYKIDRSKGTNPIHQKLDNLNNAGTLYGNIIYHKAPIMMRQLETIIGEHKFQDGIKEYIETYANSNADWNDLIEILDRKTSVDIKGWSSVWVNSAGRPSITSDIIYDDNNNIESLLIEQKAEDNSTKIWPQIFDVSLVYTDSVHSITVDLKKQKALLQSAKGLPKPKFIVYNSNGLGYGVFPTTINELEDAPKVKDEVARASVYLNCYENTLNGSISIDKAFDVFQEGLRLEQNELILTLISNQLVHLYWKYLSVEQRTERKVIIEEMLFTRLSLDETTNIKKTLFGAFKSMAHSGIARDRLYKIWSKDLVISNLALNQDDYTNIAMLLALYEHNDFPNILKEARAAITDSNKLERFDFIKPSLSNEKETRIEYFKSFADKKNREKENLVLSACYYIHHPLRNNTAIGTLELSLNLLDEIQKTGDIFFPKSWLNNTIGMYSSREAFDIVVKFIEGHPHMNPQLKLKTLQAANDLYTINKLGEKN